MTRLTQLFLRLALVGMIAAALAADGSARFLSGVAGPSPPSGGPVFIADMTPPMMNFVGGSGSAGRSLGFVVPVMSDGSSFSGTFALATSGALSDDFAKFQINPSTGELKVRAVGDLPAGRVQYFIAVVATSTTPGVKLSPFTWSPTIFSLDGPLPSVSVANLTPVANGTVSVTVTNSPHTNGSDYVSLAIGQGQQNWQEKPYKYIPTGASPQTFNIVMPNVLSEVPVRYTLFLRDGVDFSKIAQSQIMNVPASDTSGNYPNPPTATSPGFTAPFTPAATITVCASGCDYTDLNTAIAAQAVDNTLISVDGNYSPYAGTLFINNNPRKGLWIKGYGGKFATVRHSRAADLGKGLVHWNCNGPTDTLTLENMELTYYGAGTYAQAGGIFSENCGQKIWLRNVYVHDGSQGMITSTPTQDVTMENVHFARLADHGGLTHNMYIDGNNFDFLYSISTQSFGHEIKTRNFVSTVQCSMAGGNFDSLDGTAWSSGNFEWFYTSNHIIDFAQYRKKILDRSTVVNGPYTGGFTYPVAWGLDFDEQQTTGNYLQVLNSNIISEYTDGVFTYGIGIGQGEIYWDRPNCPGGTCTTLDTTNFKSVTNKFVGVPGSTLEPYWYQNGAFSTTPTLRNYFYRIDSSGAIVGAPKNPTNPFHHTAGYEGATFTQASSQFSGVTSIQTTTTGTSGNIIFTPSGGVNLSIFKVGDILCFTSGLAPNNGSLSFQTCTYDISDFGDFLGNGGPVSNSSLLLITGFPDSHTMAVRYLKPEDGYVLDAFTASTFSFILSGSEVSGVAMPVTGDTYFTSRTAAGLPNVLIPPPSGCGSRAIGNVAVPP